MYLSWRLISTGFVAVPSRLEAASKATYPFFSVPLALVEREMRSTEWLILVAGGRSEGLKSFRTCKFAGDPDSWGSRFYLWHATVWFVS